MFSKHRAVAALAVSLCLFAFLSRALPAAAQSAPPLSALKDDFSEVFYGGVRQFDRGDLEAALNSMTRASGMDPKNTQARRFLVEIYRRLHRFSEAENEYRTILLLEPDNISNTLGLAQLYVEQGKYTSAIGLYNEVLAKRPGHAEATMGLAISMEGNSDLENAKDQYRELIRSQPGTALAKSAETRLSRLEKATKAQATNRFFPIDPDLGEAGLGWWNLKRMPLTVYIDDGSGTHGYREEMRSLVLRALDTWSSASQRHIAFEVLPGDSRGEAAWQALDKRRPVLRRLERNLADVPADPVACDIHVHWTDNLPGGLGLTWTSALKTRNPVLNKAHIWISTDKMADSKPVPSQPGAAHAAVLESQERMLQEVITHEFGHALGLTHSSNPSDIMCSGIFGLNASAMAERRELSPRDVRSLAEHYNEFRGQGLPHRVLAQLKQETVDGGGGAAGTGGEGGAAAGGEAGAAPGGDAGAGGDASLPPFLGEEKPGSEEGTEEKPEEGSLLEEPGGAPSRSLRYDPIREAIYQFRSKKYDQALATLNKVLETNPRHPQAHYLKAVVYVMLRQYPEATLEYKEVLKLVPNSELGKRAADGLKKISL